MVIKPRPHRVNPLINIGFDVAEYVRKALFLHIPRLVAVLKLEFQLLQTIENRRAQLQELLPEARIAVAHGQMPERELERVMRDFVAQR